MEPTSPETSVPETPPFIGTDEPSDDTLGSQIARTDAALAAWRDESVRRRAEYDEEAARASAEADRRRRRLLWVGGGVGVGVAAAVATFAVGYAQLTRPVAAPQDPIAAHDGPAPVRARAPVVAPGVAVSPVAETPAPPPVVAVTAPAPVVEAVVEAVAVPEPVAAAPSLGIEPGSARVWSDRSHVWAAFRAADAGALRLHWYDADGAEVLEPMGCGSAECRAGRSHGRIAAAVAGGAAPGTWTVRACGADGCADVGTFSTSR